MKVKNRNLIELTFQIIICILAFIPAFYNSETWVEDSEYLPGVNRYIPVKTLQSSSSYSLFNSLFNTDRTIMIVGFILFATFICSIAFYALQFSAKDAKRNWLPTVVVSIAQTVLFVMCSLLIEANDFSYQDADYRYSLQFIFFIMLIVLIALAAISTLGYITASKKGIIDESIENRNKSFSQVAELKKYKSLLDNGIITQEEFDAKKKQLLGL